MKAAAFSRSIATTASSFGRRRFPSTIRLFLISNIDGKTGKTTINWDLVNKKLGERHTICFYNTRSFWPTAYHPGANSLYVPYIDNCLDMTSPSAAGPEKRIPVPQPGSDPNKLTGIGKINLSTGEITAYRRRPRAERWLRADDGRRSRYSTAT